MCKMNQEEAVTYCMLKISTVDYIIVLTNSTLFCDVVITKYLCI